MPKQVEVTFTLKLDEELWEMTKLSAVADGETPSELVERLLRKEFKT